MIEGKKDIEEYYDDILKELLIIRGYNKNKVYEFIEYGMNKKIKEMVESGFEKEGFLNELNDDDLMKKYKCFLSKKCNDEKFERIKKMFDYVKDDKEFIDLIGKEEYNKL